MATGKTKKYKVVFESNPEPVDQIVIDALITQLMVTVTRVGLRTNQLSENNDTIEKEKKHGSKEN